MIPVGCIGLCSSEPIMDIKLPGKKRISFEKVTEADVANILDHVFTIEVPEHPVLGQFGEQEDQMDWADVPALKDHFFFKPQLRLVLEIAELAIPQALKNILPAMATKPISMRLKNSALLSCATILKKVVCVAVEAEVSQQEKKWKICAIYMKPTKNT